MPKKSIELQKVNPIQFFWCWHDPHHKLRRRVWRSDQGGLYKVMWKNEFITFSNCMEWFGFAISEVNDND